MKLTRFLGSSADGKISEAQVSIRQKSSEEPGLMNSVDPNAEPWIYLIFQPSGTQGWHCKLQKYLVEEEFQEINISRMLQ